MQQRQEAPRARALRCPLTGQQSVLIRAGAREVVVWGPVDAEALAAGINMAVARMKERAASRQGLA